MASETEQTPPATATEKSARRKIPGNLPYTSSPGVLRRVLDRIPTSEKPGVFNPDFLGTVLGANGGAARPIIPILKSTGLLSQTGTPTELYAQFQTDSGRPSAALQALRTGFSEIFRRNQYAHRADENTLVDTIVAITGLPRKDQIVRYVLNTFQAFQATANIARDDSNPNNESSENAIPNSPQATLDQEKGSTQERRLQLVYNINIVLPETTNVEVYNAIFKSVRGNLLE